MPKIHVFLLMTQHLYSIYQTNAFLDSVNKNLNNLGAKNPLIMPTAWFHVCKWSSDETISLNAAISTWLKYLNSYLTDSSDALLCDKTPCDQYTIQ